MNKFIAHFGLGLMKLVVHLPRSTQYALGRLFGKLLYQLAKRRRRITDTNIKLCFPEFSEIERQQFVKKVFEENAIGFIETACSWFLDPNDLMKNVTVQGQELIDAALKEGRGVLIIGSHYSTLDLGVLLTATLIKLDAVYMQNSNPTFNRVMRESRERYFNHLIDKDNMRDIVKSLKKGHALWYSADQDHGAEVSVFAPFFGVEAATIKTAAKLAKIANSRVILLSHHRKPDDSGYVICFSRAPDGYPMDDDVKSATLMNRAIEQQIRKCPEQYMWVHRRFKTRPEGEKDLYAG